MLAGGAATAIIGVFLVVATIADKNGLTNGNGKKLTSGQFAGGVIESIITYAIFVALWVMMARLNRKGYNWARILASVFFAISTYDIFTLVNSLHGSVTITVIGIVYIVFTIVIWCLGVGAIAMLWRSDSSVYFKEHSGSRR
jgi:hypothetical protein